MSNRAIFSKQSIRILHDVEKVTNAIAKITKQVTYLMTMYISSQDEISDSELEGIMRNYKDYIIILNSLIDVEKLIYPFSARMKDDEDDSLAKEVFDILIRGEKPDHNKGEESPIDEELLEEVEINMVYGRPDRAEMLIRDAIKLNPDQVRYQEKLLEILALSKE